MLNNGSSSLLNKPCTNTRIIKGLVCNTFLKELYSLSAHTKNFKNCCFALVAVGNAAIADLTVRWNWNVLFMILSWLFFGAPPSKPDELFEWFLLAFDMKDSSSLWGFSGVFLLLGGVGGVNLIDGIVWFPTRCLWTWSLMVIYISRCSSCRGRTSCDIHSTL